MIPQPIKIEIKPIVLSKLCTAVDFDFLPTQHQSQRAFISLLASVAMKLAKKEISHRGGTKPLKIKLEYYEAYCLQNTLNAILDEAFDNDLQNIFNQIHQKLS